MEIPWNRNLTDQICTNHPPPLASYHCLFVCKSRKISYAVVGVVMCHVLCFSACVMFLLDNYILTRYIVFSSFKLWHHTLNFVRSCGGICWILCNEFRAMTPKCYLCYMPGCVYVCMSAWCSIHLLPELFLAPMCTVQEAWGKESEVFVLCHPCLGHPKKKRARTPKMWNWKFIQVTCSRRESSGKASTAELLALGAWPNKRKVQKLHTINECIQHLLVKWLSENTSVCSYLKPKCWV